MGQEMMQDMAKGHPGVAIERLQDAVRRLAQETKDRPLTGRTHDDADQVVGTSLTDDAAGFDPLFLLSALDQCGARVAVMGQVAGIMHGSRELTGDLDLLWDGCSGQAEALCAAFALVCGELTDQDGVPVPCQPAAFSLPKVLFRTPAASGDCCTPALLWGDLPVTEFLERCQLATAPGGYQVRYLDCVDLIRMRRAAGRVKDLRRADELERLRR